MVQPLHSLPLRKTAAGEQIETRPVYIEEWLDSLPYIDFNKTAGLLGEATAATNRQSLKPAVRLELIALYSRPYQYYLDSQIRTGTRHTLQSMEAMRAQIAVLKRIAVNLAYAARLAADDALGKKTLWGTSKPPLQALLLSMNYLSHALVFTFQEYAVTPKNVWRELHFIYDFAAGLGRENDSLVLPVGDSRHQSMSIARAYKRILFTSLADPHHLPFGAVWEIFEQLFSWTDYITVSTFDEVAEAAGRFVVDLDSDAGPVPWNKFKPPARTQRLRLLHATALNRHLESLPADGGGLALSPYYARLILAHLASAWSLPPQRSVRRQPEEGRAWLACGMNAVYFFVNGETEFRPPRRESDEIIAGETPLPAGGDTEDTTPVANYTAGSWAIVDRARGGYSLAMHGKPRGTVRIGDLVALQPQAEQEPGGAWLIGVIRWLTVSRGQDYRIGVEILAGTAAAIAVRAVSGSEPDRRFRRALLIRGEEGEPVLIAERGLYIAGRELEVDTGEGTLRRHAGELGEATLSFDRFLLQRS